MNATEIQPTPSKPKLRWYQFSLRSLLIFAVVFGIACHWCVRYYHYAKAREAYERSLAAQDCGLSSAMDICTASADYCRAQQELPFADKAGAQALHIVRLNQIEQQLRGTIPMTMFATQEGHDAAVAELDKIHALRVEAEEKLDKMQASR